MMLMHRACEHDGRCRDEKANVHAMRPCETSRALGDPNGMTLARPSPAMVAERSWAWASAVNLCAIIPMCGRATIPSGAI